MAVTQGDSLAAIATEGGSEGVKFLGDLFEAQRREADWLADTIQAGLEQERDEWMARALRAEARLARIESRLFSLLD